MSTGNEVHSSRSGELCWASCGSGVDRHLCASHLVHVEQGKPHVCCCCAEWWGSSDGMGSTVDARSER